MEGFIILRITVTFCFFIFIQSGLAQAQILDSQQLTKKEFLSVFKELSTTSTHSTLTGGSQKSVIIGAELGVLVGITKLDKVNSLAQFDKLLVPRLYGLVSFPMGLTLEGNWSPELEIVKDFSSQSQMSVAAKLNISEFLPLLSFNMAGRLFYSQGSGDIKIAADEFALKNKSWGLQAIFSWDLLFLEPYIGAGYIMTESEAQSSTPVIDGGNFVEDNFSGLQLVAGLEGSFLLLTTGIEVQKLYGRTTYLLKGGFSF